MCVNFYATKILILDDDATGVDHHGKPYRNNDYQKDSVLCTDGDGNVYHYDMGKSKSRDVATWPRREELGIPLFRNYWTFIYNPKQPTGLGPYYQAIENASKTTLIPPVGKNL